MQRTKVEKWTIEEISKAISERTFGNKRIEIPMFQRNLVWTDNQKDMFIDSVKKGFPVGSHLFYEISDNSNTYSLIDGLQRSSTICDFMKHPTKYFSIEDIDDSTVKSLYALFNAGANQSLEEFSDTVKNEIKLKIAESDLDSLELLNSISCAIMSECIANQDISVLMKTNTAIEPCIRKFKDTFDEIAKAEVPVLIFSGDESDLPTVFERINNQGTMLGKYQIFAAAWAVSNYTVSVKNEEIIKHIVDKYEAFINQGYVLQNYDKDEITNNRELSYFEYVLGLGKYLSDKYQYLFESNKGVQDINQIGFEILNACFGKHNKDIKTLHEELHNVDINLLESALLSTIDDINNILKPFISFKGNARDTVTLFHSTNQMVSIIASTFREKYDLCDLGHVRPDWSSKLTTLKITIPQHYVFDIISHGWAEGAFGKIYSILNDNKYLNSIKLSLWDSTLNGYLETMNAKSEKKNVATPKFTEKLFLNCVHLDTFSAYQQLSNDKFDIEHIVPKEKLKKIISANEWNGLPISSIGNLCYLPEYDNRSKGAKTIYEDSSYLDHLKKENISLNVVEDKYTFTSENDLKWLYFKNDGSNYKKEDYDIFANNYIQFLTNHFKKMKVSFYRVLHIDSVNE